MTIEIYELKLYLLISVVGGRSRLHLLDLGSCGRVKDGSALSLSALGSVLLALLSGQRHIPYRSVIGIFINSHILVIIGDTRMCSVTI